MSTFIVFPSAQFPRVRRICGWISCALALCATSSPVDAVTEPSALTGQKQHYGYSWQQEMKEGADADKEITQQMGLYDNPSVQDYVQAVGHRVLAASTFANPSTPEMYRNTPFTFRVLDSPVVNAFALPGGYVYVTRGLLTHVDNEAQLAVVLGHEIGHVAARHASQQARRSQWSQLGVIAGAILGQTVLGQSMPNFAQDMLTTGNQAMQVFMLRYSREAENEADTLGVGYALNAGYAAGQSARFFDSLRQLAAQEGPGLPTWMSTHPDPGNRADHVLALARAHGGQGEQRVGQMDYLRHVDGMVVGDDPRQGFTENGVFYHPTLHFQLPIAPNWKVDNQPNAVVLTDPAGRGVMGLRLAPANRTHDAAAQFTAENKVQVTASGDTTVNGLPATVIVGRANSNQGEVGVWDAFIELDGRVYSLLGYAPAQSFEQERGTFESIASGFSPLRDPRLATVQPARLRIVRAEREAPFAAYVPTSLPPKFSAESVAIMNQVGMNETVPVGASLKIPDVTTARGPQVLATAPPNPPVYPPAPGSYPPSAGYPASNPPLGGSAYPGAPLAYPAPDSGTTNYPPPAYPSTYPPGTPASTTSAPSAPASAPYPPAPSYPEQPAPSGQNPAPQYPPPSYPPTSSDPPSTPPNPYPSSPSPNGYPPSTSPNAYPPPAWPR